MVDPSYVREYLNANTHRIVHDVRFLKNGSLDNKEAAISKVVSAIHSVRSTFARAGVDEVPINTFFNELYLIDHHPINEVNDFLRRYNYKDIMDKAYASSLRSINRNIMPTGDDKVLLDFLINNDLLGKHQKEVHEFYIKNTLMQEKPSNDYKTIKNLIINYAKSLMKPFIEEPIVIVKNPDNMDGKLGYSEKGIMYLNDDGIRRFQKYGEYRIFYTIFHELKHIEQYSNIHIKKLADDSTMTIIKDEILSHLIEGYYQNNYYIMYDEVEAIINSRRSLIELFKRLNIEFRKNEEFSDKKIKQFEELLKLRLRKNGYGEFETIDDIFDNVIIYHPEYLEIYEQLQSEYRVDLGDLVIRKDDFGGPDDRNK